jgi:hypothetical protein
VLKALIVLLGNPVLLDDTLGYSKNKKVKIDLAK